MSLPEIPKTVDETTPLTSSVPVYPPSHADADNREDGHHQRTGSDGGFFGGVFQRSLDRQDSTVLELALETIVEKATEVKDTIVETATEVTEAVVEFKDELVEVLEEPIGVPVAPRDPGDHATKLTALQLAVLVFYKVSGGPFGCEVSVAAAGAKYALLGFVLFPLLWSVPEALVTAELGSAYPEPSGGTFCVGFA